MIRAAGILYRVRSTGACLWLQRGPGGDCSGQWVPPGGKIEDGETPAQAAIREAVEEAGPKAKTAEKNLRLLARRIAPVAPTPLDVPDGPTTLAVRDDVVDYTTFLVEIDEPFDVEINDESTAFAWAPAESPPEPLHPGARVALAKLSANELDVARMMAAGDLTSPQFFSNVMLLDIRITGTGYAYRKAHEEWCYRAPENYLTPDFLARCNGLPVLWDHPEKAVLTSKEWQDRAVGTTFLPYVKGDEVWGIVKIYDRMAIDELTSGEPWSTSPTVDFGAGLVLDSSCETVTTEDGTRLLVEGEAPLLDHIAICSRGVWDKGGEPSGVNTARADTNMADEDDKKRDDAAKAAADKAAADKAQADQAKADAENERFGKLMDAVSGLASRMDAWDEEKKADKKRRDADEETKKANEAADEPGAGDPDKVEKKAADKKSDEDDKKDDKRKDARKDEDEKKREDAAKADKARADSDMSRVLRELEDVKRRLASQIRSDDDFNAIGAAQAKADAVYHLMGRQAPRPYADESLLGYRRRLANDVKAHTKAYKDVDLSAVGSEKNFAIFEDGIYADAEAALRSPAAVPAGELRAVTHRVNGHDITEYHGEPKAWMSQFGGYRGSVKSFSPPNT